MSLRTYICSFFSQNNQSADFWIFRELVEAIDLLNMHQILILYCVTCIVLLSIISYTYGLQTPLWNQSPIRNQIRPTLRHSRIGESVHRYRKCDNQVYRKQNKEPFQRLSMFSSGSISNTRKTMVSMSISSNGGSSSMSKTEINSIESLTKLYYRASWLSWWIQIILSVIGGTILTFANTVRQSSMTRDQHPWFSGFALSAVGVIISFVNCFWTWNVTRLGRRVYNKKVPTNKVTQKLKKYSQISIFISLIGLAATLLGAEQIAGNLASKVLSTQPLLSGPMTYATSQNSLQALDIFLVQANTNTLVAHYAPLLCYSLLKAQLPFQDSHNSTSKFSNIIDKPLEREE